MHFIIAYMYFMLYCYDLFFFVILYILIVKKPL